MSYFFSFPKNNNLLFILSFAVSSIFLDEIHKELLKSTSPLMLVGDLNLHRNVSPKRRALTFTMLYFPNFIPDSRYFFELLSYLCVICLWFILGLMMWLLGSDGVFANYLSYTSPIPWR